MNNTHVVIMAGGIGSRLWPASTPAMPKQFIDVLGVGKSLLQLTVDRFLPLCPASHIWVITSETYVPIVMEQVPELPSGNILAEPQARNTAPCIAYSCWKIASQYPDANIIVSPADALVLDKAKFTDIMATALDFTQHNAGIVTIGIVPTRPETGYGYISAPEGVQHERIAKVLAFKEKPDLATAEKYFSDGSYFWNAGIFVWRASTIIGQLRRYAPMIAAIMDRIAEAFGRDDEEQVLRELFPTCEKISIDYAVMEKSPDIYVIAAELGWSDLGSWGSVRASKSLDEDGNAVTGGDIRLFGCRDCMVHLPATRVAVLEGLDGYVVAEKDGTLLVCRLSQEQNIKNYSSDASSVLGNTPETTPDLIPEDVRLKSRQSHLFPETTPDLALKDNGQQ